MPETKGSVGVVGHFYIPGASWYPSYTMGLGLSLGFPAGSPYLGESPLSTCLG